MEVLETPPVDLLTWQEPWSSERQAPDTVLNWCRRMSLLVSLSDCRGLAEPCSLCGLRRLGPVKKDARPRVWRVTAQCLAQISFAGLVAEATLIGSCIGPDILEEPGPPTGGPVPQELS